ncbi:MAG TPA: DUF1194 domain-containing protein [Azospirillaceae bacterium]|nr:DUF1194 domain-containing protein [Azospirillaceae bacterium]
MRLPSVAAVLLLASQHPGVHVPARAAEPVDLELVLAADGSGSIDDEELRFQREGYAQALASGPVIDAVRSGRHARIAVVYLEWGGADSQHVIADWTLIRGEEDARAFGVRLTAAPRAARGWNSISGAIDYGLRLMTANAYEGERRVIDVSADGAHFGGRPVRAARDDAVAHGVTINGLVVQPPEGRLAVQGVPLRTHFEQDVIGGAGAFVVAAESRREFLGALMAKLVREIADNGAERSRTVARSEALRSGEGRSGAAD